MTDTTFYTMTMARLLESQGNFGKAEEICRHLLAKDPDNDELKAALARLTESRSEGSLKRLVPLFRHWIDLMFEYRRRKILKRLIS